MDNHCLFTNFTFDPDVYYFCYSGELKSLGINQFLVETLSTQLHCEVQCIAIVPGLQVQYSYPNLIVPAFSRRQESLPHSAVSFRRQTPDFLNDVSQNRYIRSVIDTLLTHQDQLMEATRTVDRIIG